MHGSGYGVLSHQSVELRSATVVRGWTQSSTSNIREFLHHHIHVASFVNLMLFWFEKVELNVTQSTMLETREWEHDLQSIS